MVEGGAFSHKIVYVSFFFGDFKNLEVHPNRNTGSRVMAILLNGWHSSPSKLVQIPDCLRPPTTVHNKSK